MISVRNREETHDGCRRRRRGTRAGRNREEGDILFISTTVWEYGLWSWGCFLVVCFCTDILFS